jgi:transposase
MSIAIRADYDQEYLLSPRIEDWVPCNHPARFIRDIVGLLDLKALGFAAPSSTEGRPHYAPELLLSVYLYGYLMRIRGSRRLEQACRDQMPLLWLTGNHVPDHNTLWRFLNKHRSAMKRLFKQTVQIAVKANLIGMVLHAVDGTKLKSRSSNRTGWHRTALEEALARLDGSIEQWMREFEASEQTESDTCCLPQTLIDAKHRRAVLQSALAVLLQEERNHVHPLEPEARMQQAGSERTFGYNAQTVVDDKHGLIVGETVVTDENDLHCLVPMLEEVHAMLGSNATDTVADKGYATSEAFGAVVARNLHVTVPLTQSMSGEAQGPYAGSQFMYDAQQDVMTCPQGQQLPFRRVTKSKAGYPVREYQCTCAATCPVRWECSKSKQGRVVVLNPYLPAIEHQRARYRDPKHQQSYKRRKELIERVFAQIKEHEGFRRWTMRGLEKVQAQWSLLMTTYNLKKMYQLWKTKRFVLPSTVVLPSTMG